MWRTVRVLTETDGILQLKKKKRATAQRRDDAISQILIRDTLALEM